MQESAGPAGHERQRRNKMDNPPLELTLASSSIRNKVRKSINFQILAVVVVVVVVVRVVVVVVVVVEL